MLAKHHLDSSFKSEKLVFATFSTFFLTLLISEDVFSVAQYLAKSNWWFSRSSTGISLPLACPGTGSLRSGLTHRSEQPLTTQCHHQTYSPAYVSLYSLFHDLLPASIVWPHQPDHHVLQCDHLLLIESSS